MVDYDAIRSTVSISRVLSMYGFHVPDHGRYAILCPFHQERTASMHVNDEKGLWHCFGCGASGSVINLVARLDRISFKEAAEKLSSEFGISPATAFSLDARKVHAKSAAWNANTNHKAISIPYELRDLPAGYRNLSKNAIDHFHLSLTDYGVFFPHYDLNGHLIGYSIRQPDGVRPKYLNSPEFSKTIPYATFNNKKAILEHGFAIIVEGQIDCAVVWDAGYKNVVSLMGSSMTDSQGHLLLALTTKLVLLFDGDLAGRKGMSRINRRWSSCFSMKIELLPNGVDPADYLRESPDVLAA